MDVGMRVSQAEVEELVGIRRTAYSYFHPGVVAALGAAKRVKKEEVLVKLSELWTGNLSYNGGDYLAEYLPATSIPEAAKYASEYIEKRNDIATRLIPFLKYLILKKNRIYNHELDELVDIMMEPIFQAFESYDPSKGPFLPYCERWCMQRINRACKTKDLSELSFDAPLGDDESFTLHETIRDENVNIFDDMLQAQKQEKIEKLNLTPQNIKELSQKQIKRKNKADRFSMLFFERSAIGRYERRVMLNKHKISKKAGVTPKAQKGGAR